MSSRLRVAMICGYRPTPAGGGTEKYVYELTRGLLERGVDVNVFCEDRPFLPDLANPLAGHIIDIAPGRPAPAACRSTLPVHWLQQFWQTSKRLAEAIRPGDYHIVHCHGHYGFHVALRWAQVKRRPLLVAGFHLTALGPIERYKQLGLGEPEEAPMDRAVAFMEQAVGQLADHCIAVSRGVASELTQFYGVPPQRVTVISNWRDPSIFRPHDPLAARRLLSLEPEGRYLLYVGHFNMSRGKIMAEALRCLPPDITLLVVHHEPDERIIAEFGSRVRFTGHLSPQMLALHYSAADLLCFPSLYGGFGLVLVEAMACGCPSVVFDYPAMNELVTDECGYLVKEPTPAAYAAVVERALRGGASKSAAAQARASSYDMNGQIGEILKLYEELLSRARSNAENGEAYTEYRERDRESSLQAPRPPAYTARRLD